MSGGHFNDYGYIYYKVLHFADELEEDILNNGKTGIDCETDYSEEVIEYLKEQLPKIS